MTLQADLDEQAAELVFDFNIIATIETTADPIRVSNKPVYVGNSFFYPICKFPTIKRSLGSFLSPTLNFSVVRLTLDNIDGALDRILPLGEDFSTQLFKSVSIKIGVGSLESNYISVFNGLITPLGGIQRNRQSVIITARDRFDSEKSVKVPTLRWDDLVSTFYKKSVGETVLKQYFPYYKGKFVSEGGPQTPLLNRPQLETDPNSPYLAFDRLNDNEGDYVSFYDENNGSGAFDRRDVRKGELYEQPVYLVRNPPTRTFFPNTFEPFRYISSIKYHLSNDTTPEYARNPIALAREIMTELKIIDGGFEYPQYEGRLNSGNLFNCNVYLDKPTEITTVISSLMEQINFELFIDRSGKFAISSLDLRDYIAKPAFVISLNDIERDSLKFSIDEKSFFNRVVLQGNYQSVSDSYEYTGITLSNTASIEQIGRAVTKVVSYPNLNSPLAIKEMGEVLLRNSSAYRELIEITLTPRCIILELGQFVSLDLGENRRFPAQVRRIEYLTSLRVRVELLSFESFPFPGWEITKPGIVGGSNAVIEESDTLTDNRRLES